MPGEVAGHNFPLAHVATAAAFCGRLGHRVRLQREIREPMLDIAGRVDAEVEGDAGRVVASAQRREELLEPDADGTLGGVAGGEDGPEHLELVFHVWHTGCAVVVVELPAEPHGADVGRHATGHGDKVGRAGWCQFDARKVTRFQELLPLSGYCDQFTDFVAVLYQNFENLLLDLCGQVDTMALRWTHFATGPEKEYL